MASVDSRRHSRLPPISTSSVPSSPPLLAVRTNPPSAASGTPRNLSIRFAPLPDPRAICPALQGPDGFSVCWSREELPDGNWGEYKMYIKRANGQTVAVDDLEDPQERRIAKEACEKFGSLSQASHQPFEPEIQTPSNLSALPHAADSIQNSSTLSIHSSHNSGEIRSNNLCLDPMSPSASSNTGLPTHRSTSSEVASSPLSVGGPPEASLRPSLISSSFSRRLIDVVRRPLRGYSLKLTSTTSLPIQQCSEFGTPLQKSRSAESTSSKRRSWKGSWSLPIRRTQSKDERPSSMIFSNDQSLRPTPPLDDQGFNLFEAERARRRAKYPPVAQRKAHMGGGRGGAGKIPIVEEPEFVEWGAPSNAALINLAQTRQSALYSGKELDESPEDDGSGMAWLRKRKKEKEERLRREAEQAAQPAACASSSSETAPHATESVTGSAFATRTRSSESLDDPPSEPSVRDEAARTDSDGGRSRRSSATTSGSQRSGCLRDEDSSNESARISSEAGHMRRCSVEEEDLNAEELEEEERLKAKALMESPFLRGVKEVFKDREHHRVLRA